MSSQLKWNKLYKYPKSIRETLKGVRHYDVNDEKLPSVTTILQKTQDIEKAESLKRWTQKVGKVEAERIKDTAAKRGTAMHSYLETYLQGGKVLDFTMGSGSTGVACKNLNREFIGIELDKTYFDMASKRIDNEME